MKSRTEEGWNKSSAASKIIWGKLMKNTHNYMVYLKKQQKNSRTE